MILKVFIQTRPDTHTSAHPSNMMFCTIEPPNLNLYAMLKFYISGCKYHRVFLKNSLLKFLLVADTRLNLAVLVGPFVSWSVHLSVGRSICQLVGWSHFWIPSSFCITAPAQLFATGLPCIRPCYLYAHILHFRPINVFFFFYAKVI